LIDKTIELIGKFSAFILYILVLLVVYDATSRYLFHSGSIALQELEWHLFDVVILLAIAYTLKYNLHVRVDIFYEHFSVKTKQIIEVISMLFFVLPFSLLIIYVSFEFVHISFEQMEASSNPGGLEYRFLVKSLMPISFALVILQALSILLHVKKRFEDIK